jgi:DNA-binding XRE family transcriptional regulator
MAKPLGTLNEILAAEKPEVVKQAQEKASDILLRITLADLRELTQKTQVNIAQTLGIKQKTVAKMEKHDRNISLSSLKRYVEATGCKLSLTIELPDGTSHGFFI